MRFKIGAVVLVGLVWAYGAQAAAAPVIPHAQVPLVVEQTFQQIYGRKPTSTESVYWKARARGDKKTQTSLQGAMVYQKEHATTQAAATSVCDRSAGYTLPVEVQQGLTVLRNGLLTNASWRKALPINRWQNCLHITFASNATQSAVVSSAVAIFSVKDSTPTNLRIIINSDFAAAGHVFLGEVLAHEITHAWQYVREVQRENGNAEFARYVLPDCYTIEAEAFWTEISYVKTLSEADQNDLHDLLTSGAGSEATRGAAAQSLHLIDFAQTNWPALVKNPVPFIRAHYVMTIPYYQTECGVTGQVAN